MPFVNAGEASEASRNAQSSMQTLMEMLFKLAEAAALLKQDAPEREAEPELEPDSVEETTQGAEPSLADTLESHLERDALHDSVSRLSYGKGDGVVYQAEGFSVFRQTEAMGTTYQVTTPEGQPLLVFEQVGRDLHLVEDKLPQALKQDLLATGERLQTNDLSSVFRHPDPKAMLSTLGEASPAGTRAAWVTQQMLKGRDTFTPDQGNFKFDRDPNGTLAVTDRTNKQVLLQITPAGQITCALNTEQLEQFKPAFTRLQIYEAIKAEPQAAAKGTSHVKTAQLSLER